MRKYKLLLPVALSCGFVIASCSPSSGGGGDIPTNKINLEWDNGNELSENNLSVRCEAVLDFNDNGNAVVNWNLPPLLPTGVTKSIGGNFITFTLSLAQDVPATTINIEARYENVKVNTTLSVKQYVVPNYDYRIFLDYSSITLTQDNIQSKNNPKIVNATIKDVDGNIVSGKNVTWSGYDVLDNWIIVDTSINNSISLELQNGVPTLANTHVITASYTEPGKTIINSFFSLNTQDFEIWQPNWVPKDYLNITGNVLNGFKSGVNLDQYDTLTIPKGVVTINNRTFGEGTETKIPSNITTLDFGASVVETIGDYAFVKAPFTHNLIFTDRLKAIGKNAFYAAETSGVDLSRCSLLKILKDGTFAHCSNIQSIFFNDNLEQIEDPKGASDFGAFEMMQSNFNGTLHLPAKLKYLGEVSFAGLSSYMSPSNKITLEWNQCTALKTIGSQSFAYAKFLSNTHLIIPPNVTKIGVKIFIGSTGVTQITVSPSVTSIGANAFSMDTRVNLETLTALIIPSDQQMYPYRDSGINKNYSTTEFGMWVRQTKIEPAFNNHDSQPGAEVLVNSNLLSWYKNNWPNWITINPIIP